MTDRQSAALRNLQELYTEAPEELCVRAITLFIETAMNRLRPGTCPDYPEDDALDALLGLPVAAPADPR